MTTPATGERSAATTAIIVATAVAGGIALLAVGISTAARALVPNVMEAQVEYGGVDFIPSDAEYELAEWDLEDLEGISIDAAATSFTLVPGDVEEALLSVGGSGLAGEWSMYRDQGELVIEHPDLGSGARTGGCLFGCGVDGSASVTLTLPRDLVESGRLNADISLSGGELRGEGSFDALGLEVNAGSLRFTGAARSLDLDVRVGEARVELADVGEADVEVQTGDATVTLTGEAPRSVDATAKMGALALQLPEEEYRVDLRGALGEVDNRLAESKESPYTVRVQATAAEIVLR
ncbi:hypothetical protein [Leucobacter sp.]